MLTRKIAKKMDEIKLERMNQIQTNSMLNFVLEKRKKKERKKKRKKERQRK